MTANRETLLKLDALLRDFKADMRVERAQSKHEPTEAQQLAHGETATIEFAMSTDEECRHVFGTMSNALDVASGQVVEVDPMSRLVDGLTVRECLQVMLDNQRTYDLYGKGGGYARLTDRQRNAARSAWSLALRLRQAEARRVEREQVVCDEQWGEEL